MKSIKRLEKIHQHANDNRRLLTTFRLAPDKILALKMLAKKENCTQTDIIEDLILNYAIKKGIIKNDMLDVTHLTSLHKEIYNNKK